MNMSPEGFQPLSRTSPFLDLIGPILAKGEGKDGVIGLRVEARHCNARGSVHGGVLASLMDVALGYATAFSTHPPTPLVTASLNLDFSGTASVGDWLEVTVDVQKVGGRLAFANGVVTVGGARIVHASAVFAVVAEQARQ